MGAYTVVFGFTRKTHLPLLAIASFLAALAGMVPPATSILVGKLMNLFSQFDAGTIDGDDLGRETQVWVVGLLILGSAAFAIRATFYCAWIVNGELQAKVVREHLFSSLVIRDYEWFEAQTSGVGSLLGRIQVQIRELQLAVSQPLGMVILTISQTVSSLSVAFYYSWKLTLILLAIFPLIALTLSFLNRGLQTAIEDQHKEMINAAKQAAHATNNVTLLRCYNGIPKEIRRYEHILQLVSQHYRRQVLKAAKQIAFMRLAAVAIVVVALSFGAYLVHESRANPGAILSTFWCCGTASRGFSEILAQSPVLEKSRASALSLRRLIHVVDNGKKLAGDSNACSPLIVLGDIDFQNVTFAYPTNPDQVVLNRLTLSFRACQTMFVIGRSGSGKSTISHLLLRLYKPVDGHIRIDGKSLENLDTDWLRNNVTVVQQDSVLFNETLSKNIALGCRDLDELQDRQIFESADFAILAETIRALPKGIDTMVGKEGRNLSGGQRQRVALARARLRDTPILILDECTSALDHTTRVHLLKNIRTWRKGKSTIIITHDLSQIKLSDFTYVLRDGVVVAGGRRADLESLSEWPSEVKGTINFALPSATHEVSVGHTMNQDLPLKHPYLSLDTFPNDGISDLFGEQVSLLETTADYSRWTRPDRGRAFRALLRNEDYPVPQQVSIPATNLSQELDTAICNSEYEMSKTTKSRVLRNQLTMTQAARPYSTFSSLSTRPVGSNEGYRKPISDGPITASPKSQDDTRGNAEPVSGDVVIGSAPNKPSSWKILVTIWPLLPPASQRRLMGALLMSIVYGSVPSAVSWITVKLFQTLYQASGWVEDSRKWSLVLMGVASMEAIAAFCIHLTFETLAQTWINMLRLSALTMVLNKPKSWFDEESRSLDEICTTIDRGAEEMRNILGRFVPFVLIVIVMLLISFIVCMIKCWRLTMLGIGCAPVIYAVTKVFQMTSVLWESRTTDAVNIISEVFAESFGDVQTVRALTLESFFHRKFMTANVHAFTTGLKRAASISLCFGVSESLVPFIIAAIFKYATVVTRSQEFPTQNVLIVLSSMIFTMLGASAILSFIPQISSSIESGARLLQLTRLEPHLEDQNGELKLDRDKFSGTVKLRDVNFSYPNRPGAAILRNVDLTLSSGKITAVVGRSGSGKSTLLSLILGLYPVGKDSSAGSIIISGHAIPEFDTANLRSFIAYVPQQPALFPLSIRENILYAADVDQSLGDRRLHSAAKAAGIHDFIVSLPEAYDTLVGDGGSNVSGGQAQRIVIARALAMDPLVLLMDEPTSALDVESAGVIRNTIRARKHNLHGNTTTIIVTHCEEMMKLADNVVVFEDGKIVEEGNYFELMARCGKLKQLVGSG